MDFRLELITSRERRALLAVAIAAGLLVFAMALYAGPSIGVLRHPESAVAARPVHSTVDVGSGRTVVVVTRVRAPGFVGPMLLDQDHWITVDPAERPAPRAGRRPRRM
jgi:hypothetical protein